MRAIILIRDAPDRKITGYRISGQNTTLDIREGNFFELDIFQISKRIPRKCLLKKKTIGKKIVILRQYIRYYSIMNMHTYFLNTFIQEKNQQFNDIKF